MEDGRAAYLVYAPIEKLPKEKEIIRSKEPRQKAADSIVIATDFDREGGLSAPMRSHASGGEPYRPRFARPLFRLYEGGNYPRVLNLVELDVTWRPPAHRARISTLSGARCSRAISPS